MRLKRLAPVVGALIALLVAACGGGGGGASSTGGVVFGSSLSLSGSLGSFGVLQQKGYQQAVNDLNAAGGINVGGSKQKVSLNVLDNRSDPSLASQQSRQLALKNNATSLLGASTPPINIPDDGYPGTDHMMATLGKQLSLTDLQFAVSAYTVVQVVADAITKAGSTDPAKINSALAQTDKKYTFANVKFNSAHIAVTPHGVVQWVGGKTVKLVPPAGQNVEYPAGGLKA